MKVFIVFSIYISLAWAVSISMFNVPILFVDITFVKIADQHYKAEFLAIVFFLSKEVREI